MKIVINTAHQRFGGAIQVALSFIQECRHLPGHEYHVWVGPGVSKSLKEEDFPDNFHFSYFDFGKITLGKTFIINRSLREAERKIRPDAIIATSGPSYFHSRAPQIIGYNLPLYVYPESPYVQQWSLLKKLRMTLRQKAHFYFFKRDASAYVVQTDDVNTRLRKSLGENEIFTVSNTVNGFYNNRPNYPPKLRAKKRGTFRFLTPTAYYPHKNLELIPSVLKALKQEGIHNVEFVLTLKPEDYMERIDYHPGITNVGPVRPEECPALYHECDGLFLPTLAECFSASYPEAMKMEKPIVTTDLGFAKSICGMAALYFEPMDAIAATEQIKKLISSPDLQNRLIKQGKQELKKFDTPRTRAEKYLQLCEQVVQDRKSYRIKGGTQ